MRYLSFLILSLLFVERCPKFRVIPLLFIFPFNQGVCLRNNASADVVYRKKRFFTNAFLSINIVDGSPGFRNRIPYWVIHFLKQILHLSLNDFKIPYPSVGNGLLLALAFMDLLIRGYIQ
ncbi:hypothetical protein SEVIR_J003402v4 [Setaria viridis]|uniref:Uncharacterized protein n=1 Tax=Setaria viridis TaxID=4556 RepID=A0ACC3P2K6_SETVI